MSIPEEVEERERLLRLEDWDDDQLTIGKRCELCKTRKVIFVFRSFVDYVPCILLIMYLAIGSEVWVVLYIVNGVWDPTNNIYAHCITSIRPSCHLGPSLSSFSWFCALLLPKHPFVVQFTGCHRFFGMWGMRY